MNNIPLIRENFGMGWRWLTVVAGLLLAIMFFVPLTGSKISFGKQVGPSATVFQTDGSDEFRDSPRIYWFPLIQKLRFAPFTSCLTDMVIAVIIFGLPYFWGACMALYSLFQIFRKPRLRRTIRIIGVTLSFLAMLTVAAFVLTNLPAVVTLAKTNNRDIIVAGFLAIITVLLLGLTLHTIKAIRRGSWGYLYHGFMAALVSVAIFATEFYFERFKTHSLNGMTIGMAAAILLLLSRIGEALAISRISWFKTLLGLLRFQLERDALPLGHCLDCGYNLAGLSENRCPECGRSFNDEELGLPLNTK